MRYCKARGLGAVILAASLVAGVVTSAQAADDSITIGWTSWSDATFVSQLVKQQLEAHTALDVNAQKLAIDVQYQAVANGDIDGMVMAWLPDTHKNYWQDVHDEVVDLGPIYTGAVVGWAVPAYVSKAKIDSIEDLKDPRVAKQLDGKVVGIDPGAGEMRQSRQAMQDYGLQGMYELKTGSDQSMTQVLAQAIQKLEPIVVTLWTPHWAFAKWNLRFLKDPKNDFGGAQHVDVIVRTGFREDYPKAAKFLSNLYIPLDDLQHAMYVAEQTNEHTAVTKFVHNHPDLVAAWWIGTGADVSRAAADAAILND